MPFTTGLGTYTISWMREGIEVGSEPCGLKKADEVVRYAQAKVSRTVVWFAAQDPDEFRVYDESGNELGRYPARTAP